MDPNLIIAIASLIVAVLVIPVAQRFRGLASVVAVVAIGAAVVIVTTGDHQGDHADDHGADATTPAVATPTTTAATTPGDATGGATGGATGDHATGTLGRNSGTTGGGAGGTGGGSGTSGTGGGSGTSGGSGGTGRGGGSAGDATDTGGGPAVVAEVVGPSLVVNPAAATTGASVTVHGSGFRPSAGVSFRLANQTGQDWPVAGFATVGTDGSFTGRTTLDAPFCNETGTLLAFYGRSDLRVRSPDGTLAQPVAGVDVTVSCS